MTEKRPVRTLRFSVVKERNKWLVRYKGVGGKSRTASKEEVQLGLALREANEDRSKLRIQRQKYEYTVKAMRFAVDIMRHACGVNDAACKLIKHAKKSGSQLYKLGGRPDYMLSSCKEFEAAFELFEDVTKDAKNELGVKAPQKEK